MKNKLLIILLIIVCIPTYVLALEVCDESEEHIKWSNLSDEEKSEYEEPPYCSSSYTSSSSLYFKKSYINTINNKSNVSRYSSVDEGIITTPKNQGSTSSCWTFAANSLVETSALKNGLIEFDFSEKHMEYSMTRSTAFTDGTNELGLNRLLDSGGNSVYAASYYFRGSGPILEEYMAYGDTPSNDTISINDLVSYKSSVLVGDYSVEYNSTTTCTENSIEDLKNKILEYGSVGISMYMYYSSYMKSSKYYYYNGTGNKSTNHAVVLVGWDDTISASNFKNSPDSDGAFIVKNSWGDNVGDNGYFYISYSDYRLCATNYTFSDVVENDYDNNYSSSIGLANYNFSLGDTETSYYVATTYTTNESIEYLSRISFEVEDDSSYEVYVSTSNSLDTSTWTKVGSGDATTTGVKTVTFDDIIVSGNYKIIIKYTGSGYKLSFACKTLTGSIYDYITIPEGTNYYSPNGSDWYGMEDISYTNNYSGCVPIIYAYTRNTSTTYYDYSITSITSSSDVVYDNTDDYFTINISSINTDDSKFNYYIYNELDEDVTSSFDISGLVSSGSITIKQNNNTISGKYTFKLIYESRMEKVSFTILATLSSNTYTIKDSYIIIHDSGNRYLTYKEFLSNLTFKTTTYKILNKSGDDITSSVNYIGTGMILSIVDTKYYIVYMGDVSGDGYIRSNDALLISRYIVNAISLDDTLKMAADVSGDGYIRSNDALLISRYIVALNTSL